MRRYLTWLKALPGRPVFVGYPAAYDFMFVYWYLIRFVHESPFSHSALDIKTYAMVLLEKGYRDFGHDMDNLDTLLEAGLGFAADLKKPGGFLGREAVLKQKAKGHVSRRLVSVRLTDPEPMLFHAEVLHRNGKVVGYVRAGSYGFTVGAAVGLAMLEAGEPVNQAYLDQGTWQVDIAGKLHAAAVSLRPFYDPDMKRVKG